MAEAANLDALKRRSELHVSQSRRIGRDDLSGHFVDDRILWTGEPRLINGYSAEQIETACANISDFEHEVCAHRVLHAGVVLLKVRRAHVSLPKHLPRWEANDCVRSPKGASFRDLKIAHKDKMEESVGRKS